MEQQYKVKGSSISSKFAFVKAQYGDVAEAQLREQLADSGHFPILDALWYPFSFYLAVNEAIAERHFGGDLTGLREVGQYSAARVLSTTYRAWVQSGDFIGFLRNISGLHSQIYSHGKQTVTVGTEGRYCRIDHTDKPEYPLADLYVAEGFYAGAAKHLGLTGVAGRFQRTAEGVSFELKWD